MLREQGVRGMDVKRLEAAHAAMFALHRKAALELVPASPEGSGALHREYAECFAGVPVADLRQGCIDLQEMLERVKADAAAYALLKVPAETA